MAIVALVVLLVLTSAVASGPASPAAIQTTRDAGCTDWHDCRRLALAAAERGDFEAFHDLAWRTVQTGPPRDPALMYLLARAQSLSGRPHDALIMLLRLADMGVPSDAATSDDFARVRQLPGWADADARMAAAAGGRPLATAPAAAAPSSAATAPSEAIRFSTPRFDIAGLAYDAVSHRFLFGDRIGRKLIMVAEGSNHTVDLVRADSAGFQQISAIEIDAKRGDLWVASAAAGDGGTLHKLQLISGRPLKSFRVAPPVDAVALVDLAVSPAGSVLVLDSTSRQLFVLRAGGTSLERVARIDPEEPASVTAGEDDGIAYVAHREGVSRIDLRSRTTTPVAAPNGVSLAHLERIRWYRHALIAVAAEPDSTRRIIRLALNATGRAVTEAVTLQRSLPSTGQLFVTISGDELIYLAGRDATVPSASTDTVSAPAEFVAYRVSLR